MRIAYQQFGVRRHLLDHVHGLELLLALSVSGRVITTTNFGDSLRLVKFDGVVLLDVIDILIISLSA